MRIPLACRLLPALLLAALASPAAQERVDLELVLLADASGSIDEAEIRFQRQGWAAAITHPEILGAIGVDHGGKIAVVYVEWGMASSQAVIVPWTVIDSQAAAADFAQALLGKPRQAFGANAIGSAIAFAQREIEGNTLEGHRKVIDLAGDSANSWSGVPLETARRAALEAGITINGLALSCPASAERGRSADRLDPGSQAIPGGCSGRPVDYDVEAAFERTIIGGPASFVVTADTETSFAEAARRKLLLEIAQPSPRSRQVAGR